MDRYFNECLWCDTPVVETNQSNPRGNFFCGRPCYLTASRCIRMGLGSRKSGGKSGIQTMLLGLILKTLERHPDGLVLKDLVAITHWDYSDYGKLLNANKLHHYFRIYVNPDMYSITPSHRANLYRLTNGTCLKDWIRPQYREYLETFDARMA